MFDLTNGYRPRDWNDLVSELVESINKQFDTTYTNEDIVGTNLYKYFYGGLQLILQSEQAISSLSANLTHYIIDQNERLNLPKCTVNGFISAIEREQNLHVSIKPIMNNYNGFTTAVTNYLASLGLADSGTAAAQVVNMSREYLQAGNISLAVNLDDTTSDYEERKQAIFQSCHDNMSAGLVYNGDIQGSVIAINGQSWDYAFTLAKPVILDINITITISRSVSDKILSDQDIIKLFKANFDSLYRLGMDFEGERYLDLKDLPYAGNIATAWSVQGSGTPFTQQIKQSNYDDLIELGSITVLYA